MSDREARARARRERAVLYRSRLGAGERDLHPLQGVEAISLLTHLTRVSWGWSRSAYPAYERREIPCRFLPFSSR
jgi:hypothetical protein